MLDPIVCVIYNPAAGKGRGTQRLHKLRRVLANRAVFWPTEQGGHAEDLARRAALDAFPIVAAAGGDGTAHEVANGILQSDRTDVTFAVIPIGSANDYAYSLGLDADWWLRPDDHIAIRPVDVGLVASGDRRRFFINGLGLGFNGAVTLHSRQIKHLQGMALYSLALARALWFDFVHPPMKLFLDGKEHSGPTFAVSLALGQREGNFVVAPQAILDDGLFDYLVVGALRRRDLFTFVPRLAVGRLPKDHPLAQLGRCSQMRLKSECPLTVHTDGEFFCRPADGCRELTVELLPRRLRVFSRLRQSMPRAQSS